MQADQPLGDRRQVDLQLLDQMLAQAPGPAQARLEVEALVVEIGAAAAADRPTRVEPAVEPARRRVRPAFVRRRGPAVGRLLLPASCRARRRAALARAAPAAARLLAAPASRLLLALEQRVLLELALDVGRRARDCDSCSSLIACCSCGVITSALALTQIETRDKAIGGDALEAEPVSPR